MSSQLLNGMFDRETYGPRNGFSPREWQAEFLSSYSADAKRFREAFPSVQHAYCLYAGTGGGKTKGAGLAVSRQLNTKAIEQVVYVCPNNSICHKTRRDFLHHFGVDLARFNARKHAEGFPSLKQGYILTYSHLMKNPELHGRLCASKSTLVIFDEIHHLGDANGWGDAARTAFDKVPYVLALTGTPYRSDNTKIPFVDYDAADDAGIMRFRPDYAYNLGRAVADGVCRKPLFHFSDGTVKYRMGVDSGESTVSFEDAGVAEEIARLRLRGSVKFGSESRRTLLAQALERCKAENRKAIVFLGGDTEGDQTPTEDATTLLPTELEALGLSADDYEVVVGDDKESQRKIEQFGQSGKRVLVSINMVSEGVDIPQVSAAIFLTSITAKQTTVQRVGRALRLMGPEDTHQTARIFMFADPNLVDLADEIEDEIRQEIKLREAKREAAVGKGEAADRTMRAEAIGIAGGDIKTVRCNGHSFPIDLVDRARLAALAMGLPHTEATYYGIIKLMEAKHGHSVHA